MTEISTRSAVKTSEMKSAVDFSKEKILVPHNPESVSKTPNLDPITRGLEEAAAREAALYQAEQAFKTQKEIAPRPEVKNLGKAVAFFVEPPVHLSPEAMVAQINQAAQTGIIIRPTEEGRKMVGYLSNSNQVELLKQMGDLYLGLPGLGDSLLYYDKERGVSVAGCLAILAAARAAHGDQKPGQAYQIVQEANENTELGYKKTLMEPFALPGVNYGQLPADLTSETYGFIDPSTVKTSHYKKLYAVKVDINDFGKALERATEQGQIKLIQDFIVFFNKLSDQLKTLGQRVRLGEQTTDSLMFYLPNLATKRSVEAILNNAVEDGFSFKAVGKGLNNVTVAETEDGHIIHTDQPISPSEWKDREDIVKDSLAARRRRRKRKTQKKIQSHVFMKHTDRSAKAGIKST